MKSAYRETGRRHDRQAAAKKRGQKRQRRLLGALLLAGCVLLVVAAASFLSEEGEILGIRLGAPSETEEAEPAAPTQEEEAAEAADEEVPEETAGSQPSVLLGEYFTDYAWDPDEGRQANLKMAAGAIDETVLKPGEEFSAVEVLSPLDYEQAKVFTDGGVAYEEGGGLCQVSSTLYMAANYAGLEITERKPHYAELPYIRPGLDATVWFGNVDSPTLDMKFRNNTDGDILIREFVNEDGFLVAQIYGEEPTGKTVSMTSERTEESPLKGLEWTTYKTVTDEDGETLEDGTLFETTYSYNPPTPEEFKHETHEPRGSGWLDLSNTTNWNDKN